MEHSLGLVSLAVSDYNFAAVNLMYVALVCMAVTSATVVNALTAYASLQCDNGVDEDTGKAKEEHPDLVKGHALGTLDLMRFNQRHRHFFSQCMKYLFCVIVS